MISNWTDSRRGKFIKYSTSIYTIPGDNKKRAFITCSLKYEGDTISLGFGPTPERAQKDAIANIPTNKRYLLEEASSDSSKASSAVA